MPRTDVHLDGMLRHLGAAYYESLHGRATRAGYDGAGEPHPASSPERSIRRRARTAT
jgi:hypothetical protein